MPTAYLKRPENLPVTIPADVTVTNLKLIIFRKNVKKPAGSAPGFVVYYTNYSLTIHPDISGLTLVESSNT